MQAQNLIVIMSDEHQRAMAGCYGHEFITTPNIDSLAARGTRFDNAYTSCPICVPARASFATGKHNYQIGFWDNADPYDGSIPSWHRRLRDTGHEVVSVGKLHFRSSEDDNGFSHEILPMHVIEGKGDLMGLVREDIPVRGAAYKMANMAGPGESPYTLYDRQIAAEAAKWLHDQAPKHTDKPWVLFVSFVTPHFPLTAPPEHYYRYYNDPDLPMPKAYAESERHYHPYINDYANSSNYDAHFKSEDDVRRGVAGYFGLCSFLDEQIGKVISALEESGNSASTRIVYTSDHGDSVGARGLWGKSNMYEEAASVPLIAAGEGIPKGKVIDTAATFLDIYPFIIDCVGENRKGMVEPDHPGTSIIELANGMDPDRTILSEYHAMGSTGGIYMLRDRRYKYVHFVNYAPQLFDLQTDPGEMTDLAGDPAYASVLADFESRLRKRLDPEEVDRRAKARQNALLKEAGGRDAVIKRGDLGYSPPPGYQPELA
ncbi:sulfatase-like hydrolase/transferase [Aurantimonas sp. A2-1-M11]|uniref:sulfatase-like hydrolase/transferase n=1 Tax=Aurantimonas sp. A2-1-M11 TaxID=3113712 RepID=UPI002F951EC3